MTYRDRLEHSTLLYLFSVPPCSVVQYACDKERVVLNEPLHRAAFSTQLCAAGFLFASFYLMFGRTIIVDVGLHCSGVLNASVDVNVSVYYEKKHTVRWNFHRILWSGSRHARLV